MTDKVQAKQDLEFCSAELSKYQNLSRSGLTLNELLAIDGIMIKLKERIKNLRVALYALFKAISGNQKAAMHSMW